MTIDVLLLVPLMAACAFTIAFLFMEGERKWKVACVACLTASFAMRFAPGLKVPVVIPFLLEGVLAIGLSIWFKMHYP